MNVHDLLDASSAHVVGFDWLARAVAPVSPYGDRVFETLRPFRPGDESAAQARCDAIAHCAEAMPPGRLDAIRSVLAELPDVAGALARAAMGDALDDAGFLELRRFCTTIERTESLAAEYSERPAIFNDAVAEVGGALAPAGRDASAFYIADAFDSSLAAARALLAREQAELDAARGRENARAARALGREAIESDEFIVMRSDLRGSLPAGVRAIREAPTYVLCALEYGETTLAALARRDAAATAVAEAEERVRARLSALVRDRAALLGAAARGLGELDVLVAAARYAQRFDCVAPLLDADPVLSFEGARFLPLEGELAAAGRQFVPLDLELRDVAVLTGPNMGGKSVSLQTCGFLALACALGLPVPAKRARCAIFDQIAWLGLGRNVSIGGLLSSFAREVVELKAILARGAPRLLILVDEFARTTTPHEGKALLIALLERLRERGAVGMLATHLSGVSAAAGVRHFAVRGLRGIPQRPAVSEVAQALAALAEAMDYTIEEVGPDARPRTDAIALTELLGVDADFVAAAHRALSQ